MFQKGLEMFHFPVDVKSEHRVKSEHGVVVLAFGSLKCLYLLGHNNCFYVQLLKTVSLDNAIQEFSLALPLW